MSSADDLIREAVALHRLGQLDAAAGIYQTVLESEPERFDARHMLGVVRLQQERIEEAIGQISAALQREPNSADAHCDMGFALLSAGRLDESISHYSAALVVRPDDPEALLHRGDAMAALQRYDRALADYASALALKPNFADALVSRGKVLLAVDRSEQAIADFERALLIAPNAPVTLSALGKALARQGRNSEALACFDAVLALDQTSVDALNERGLVLWALSRHHEAIVAYDTATGITTTIPALYGNRGNAWLALGQHGRALDDYDRALAIDPNFAGALRGRGHALTNLGRLSEAAASYEQAAARDPNLLYVLGYAAHARAQLCDWRDYNQTVQRIVRETQAGRRASVPFTFLALSQDPAAQLACARTYVRSSYPIAESPRWKDARRTRDRIRVAYLSADFHNHATAYLIAELFELHDRARFEIFGISYGPESADATRLRLQASVDRFIDVSSMSDADVAELLCELEVDIAIDLKGFTLNARPGIFACRGAPIQVNYLGYPGTLGAEFIDYIIADSFVTPAGCDVHYAERIVRLPDCYQVNDSKRRIADRASSRSEVGLPDQGFVFCCFNGHFKITPALFDIWMRLLKCVDGSILWLLGGSASAQQNLCREAQERGVDPSRLVFAPWMPLAEHLARHRIADLFLDTLPCNAHTTASDALWAGLPVLTCAGTAFASRVAGSLLHALNLPELVTGSLSEYESIATKLATHPSLLGDIREKLARARLTAPLFQTDRSRRHIEAAFLAMWEIYERGEAPRSFSVERAGG